MIDVYKGKKVEFNKDEILSYDQGFDLVSFVRHHYNHVKNKLGGKNDFKVGKYGYECKGRFVTLSMDGYVMVEGEESLLKDELLNFGIEYEETENEKGYSVDLNLFRDIANTEGLLLYKDSKIKDDLFYMLYNITKVRRSGNLLNLTLRGYDVKYNTNKVSKMESKYELYDYIVRVMIQDSNYKRKNASELVYGGGVKLIKNDKDFIKYKEILIQLVDETIKEIHKGIVYTHLFSNTTTSCYFDFDIVGLGIFKLTVRDHDKIKENDYVRMFVDTKRLSSGDEDYYKEVKEDLYNHIMFYIEEIGGQ